MRLRSRFDAVPQARQPQITGRLPPVPGPVQPTLDDRKRQEASAFTWACVTGGEPRFAPRPIEEMQPEQVRRTWMARRGSTWWQLTRPDPLNYYAELRKLLIEHARHLASRIDSSSVITTTVAAAAAHSNAVHHVFHFARRTGIR